MDVISGIWKDNKKSSISIVFKSQSYKRQDCKDVLSIDSSRHEQAHHLKEKSPLSTCKIIVLYNVLSFRARSSVVFFFLLVLVQVVDRPFVHKYSFGRILTVPFCLSCIHLGIVKFSFPIIYAKNFNYLFV